MKVKFAAILMLLILITGGCGGPTQTLQRNLPINKIDSKIARSIFIDKLVDTHYEALVVMEQNKNKALVGGQDSFPQLIKDGIYQFAGVKNISDKFYVFLFEPSDVSYKYFGAYVFKFNDNPVISIYRHDDFQPGSSSYGRRFYYHIELDDIEYCFGQTLNEPYVDENTGKVTFSDKKEPSANKYSCFPYWERVGSIQYTIKPMFRFTSYDKMVEFVSILTSVFPNVKVK